MSPLYRAIRRRGSVARFPPVSTAGGCWVLLTEPPARKRPLDGDAEQAEVDFALKSLRGGAEVLEVLEAYSALLVLERFGSYMSS
jgi:hypothetical protein